VVADVMDAAKNRHGATMMQWEDGGDDVVFPLDEVANRWYVRSENGGVLPGAQEIASGVCLTGEAMTRPQLEEAMEKGGVKAAFVMRVL
jgi:hypothetical protein